MLFILGFLVVFLFGGLTGVILASPPLDFAVSDTYFVVAHFHYVLFGTVVFCMLLAGSTSWWPKWTGKMLDDTLGKWHFWFVFIGFNMTFLVQHWLGLHGHAAPRRQLSWPADGKRHHAEPDLDHRRATSWELSTLLFLYNVYTTCEARASSGSPSAMTRGATRTRWSGRPVLPAATA